MKQKIFISYSWANSDIADRIDKAFQPTGLIIQRDIREIPYKGSIKDYMQQVRLTDFVLLIVSDDFLKSPNAMFEVLELLKDTDFKAKILPIILDNTKIYKPEDRLEYVKYWTQKHKELEEKLKLFNPTDAIDIYRDLKHYERIRTTIGEFLTILNDLNSPSFSELAIDNFQKIFNYIGISDQTLINAILALEELTTIEEKDIEMDKLEEKYSNNAKIYFTKGHYAFENNQLTKSSYYYRKAIELDPSFAASYYNLGYNIEFHDNDFAEAKKLYEKAIEIEPGNTKAYINLSRLYSTELNDKNEAKKLLEKVLLLNPFDEVAHYNLAVTLHKYFNDFELARFHYQRSIEIKKDFISAKYNFGILLSKEFKAFAEAKNQFLEILEIEPSNKKTLMELSKLFEFEYKHFNTAKIYYDKFIKIEPNDAQDHYWYATFLISYFPTAENKNLARKHYDMACSMDKSFKSARVENFLIDSSSFNA